MRCLLGSALLAMNHVLWFACAGRVAYELPHTFCSEPLAERGQKEQSCSQGVWPTGEGRVPEQRRMLNAPDGESRVASGQ